MSKREEIVNILAGASVGTRDKALRLADRIIACMAEPTEAMIEAAADGIRGYYPVPLGTRHLTHRDVARAALAAAGKAMVQP